MAINIETAVPVVRFNGLNTAMPVNFASAPSISLGNTTFQGDANITGNINFVSGASLAGPINFNNYFTYNAFSTLASGATVLVNPSVSNLFTYNVPGATSIL